MVWMMRFAETPACSTLPRHRFGRTLQICCASNSTLALCLRVESSVTNAAVEETDPNSLLSWYRKLINLHHSNATIHSGEYLTINRDDQNVLITIRKPKNVSPTNPILLILCNLSGQPQHLSIKADTMKLHLRGSFLRTVIRSDNGMGTMHLESMTLAPYASYIGELRF